MAKRTRYPGRPAGRRPSSNRAAKPARPAEPRPLATVAPESEPSTELDSDLRADLDLPTGAPAVARSVGLTEAEIQRAAELEAEATAVERAAIKESIQRRARARSPEPNLLSGDVNAPLSVRAAHEYAYVARDVRRIVLTGALMVAILAVLDILVNVMGVVTL